jgi:hypothetical protein
VWSIAAPQGILVCSGGSNTYDYNATPANANAGGDAGCKLLWSVEGGYLPAFSTTFNKVTQTPDNLSLNGVNVIWNEGIQSGKVTLTVRNCTNPSFNEPATKVIYFRTISTETPTTTMTLPVAVEKGNREVSLSIERVKVANTGTNDPNLPTELANPVYANQYEWTLPNNNWSFVEYAGTVARTPSPTIRVRVDALGSGSVSVRGIVTTCNPNNFSKTLALPIVRTTPNTSISATPQANKITGFGVLECGITDTIVFNASLSSGLSARNYQWRFTENAAGYKFVRANGVLKDTAITTERLAADKTRGNILNSLLF